MTTHTLPTIAAGAHATKSIATCARLLALAGLDEMLQGKGRYTLFAPTDLAFSELSPDVMASLENDAAKLRATLEYHILSIDRELCQIRNGKVSTVEGTLLTSSVTDGGLRLDHANVCGSPLRCANGVIHQIDAVLFPGFTPPPSVAAQKESPWSGLRRASRASNALPATLAQVAEALFQSPASPPPIGSASR
jgi:uncharacterized surface protein with fasciclin (FAS1) repeats